MSRPVKGILTGPVTMLAWSFVRADQLLSDTARQAALAVHHCFLPLSYDEVTPARATPKPSPPSPAGSTRPRSAP